MTTWRFPRLTWMALALLLAGAPVIPASAQEEARASADLTLAEAVNLAVEKHPALRAATYQTAAASAGVDAAQAGFLPRLDFSEGLTRSDNPVYAFGSLLNQGRFTSADFAVEKLNHPDAINNWRTNIAASMPLFMGGRTVLGYQQAQIGRDVAEHGRARVQQEVIFGAVRAYYGVLLAQETQATVESAVRTGEANLAAAESRVDAGMAVASDALAARVRLGRLKEEGIAAANHLQLARAGLNDAMGVALDQSYRLTGHLELPALRQEPLASLETLAGQQRPDLRQAALEEQRLEKEVRRAKGAFLPSMHLMGNYEVNNHRFSSDGQDSWSVGVILNWNLFTGGADRARLVEAQASHQRAVALRERLASTIALEVRDAFLDLQTARQRVSVARDAVTDAEESLRIVQDRYEAGLTTVVELLDSETALTAARTNLTRTLYDVTVGQARLDLSLGALDPARY